MPKKGSFAIDLTGEDSEQEGHPADVLIVGKAVERKRKRDIELIEASDDEAEAKAAAKQARKAARRASRTAQKPASSNSPTLNADHDHGDRVPVAANNATGKPEAVLSATATTEGASAQTQHAAKVKKANSLLSPDNAVHREPNRQAVPALEPATSSGGQRDSSATAAQESPADVAADAAASVPTRKSAFPAFGVTTAAADSDASNGRPHMASNLPGGAATTAREGGSGIKGGVSLTALMQGLRDSPLQSPLPKLPVDNSGPGSDHVLAALGISPPARRPAGKQPGKSHPA